VENIINDIIHRNKQKTSHILFYGRKSSKITANSNNEKNESSSGRTVEMNIAYYCEELKKLLEYFDIVHYLFI
jgi:hypothetical protein